MKLISFLCVIFLGLENVNGHGWLVVPASRNSIAKERGLNYCPHCMAGGGVVTTQANDEDRSFVDEYPAKDNDARRHGLCGDRVGDLKHEWGGSIYGTPKDNDIRTTYQEGQSIDLVVDVTAHHHGFFEFRLCDMSQGGVLTQKCLNKHILQRDVEDPSPSPVDANYPSRFYMLPKCHPSSGSQRMRYKLPAGVSCEHCVLQWWWITANTCHPGGWPSADFFPSEYSSCYGDGGTNGWVPRENSVCRDTWYPEEFWNCADVRILPSGGSSPGPAPTAKPTVPPTTQPPTTQPPTTQPPTTQPPTTQPPTTQPPTTQPPAATKQPTTAKPPTQPPTTNQQCSQPLEKYSQDCRSQPNCCPAGTGCFEANEWWAGCFDSCPDSTTWSCKLLSDEIKPIEIPQGCDNALTEWQGCLDAPGCCAQGLSCFKQHQWYAQCLKSCPDSSWDCTVLGARRQLRG